MDSYASKLSSQVHKIIAQNAEYIKSKSVTDQRKKLADQSTKIKTLRSMLDL